MQVQIQTTVDIDELVTVSVEDITCALAERFEKAKESPESEFIVHSFVDCVYQCLLAMNEAFVERMNQKHRKMIWVELDKIACRFRDRTG